jgi:hypothetical protein
MNKIKCGDCVHYHEQEKFTPVGPRPAWYGWCAKKSIYPHHTPDGMMIPEGVTRASESDTMSKPVIVEASKTVSACTDAVKK